LLTLFITPVIFVEMDRFGRFLSGLFSRKKNVELHAQKQEQGAKPEPDSVAA
jgi:HAE1 family hydrophobic/amphiphilic exporter-1